MSGAKLTVCEQPITTLNIPFKALLEALPYVDGGKYNVLEIATLMWLAGFDAKDTLFTTRSAHVRAGTSIFVMSRFVSCSLLVSCRICCSGMNGK